MQPVPLEAMQRVIGRKQKTRHNAQVSAWVLDLALGMAVTLVVALLISNDLAGSKPPDAIAYVFACGFGALLLVRRRFPLAVLGGTMGLLFAYYTLGYPAIGLAVPVVAALYSAAEFGHWIAAIIVSLILISVSTSFRLRAGEPIVYVLGYELISTMTLMATAIALGDSIRSRRALRAEQEQTARLIEQEQMSRAEQQVQAERVRMARDLHDTIGHSISVISLHANVAHEAIGSDDDQVQHALAQIRAVSSATMRELRAIVKLLRRPDSERADRSIASLAHVSTLIENATASGLQLAVQIDGDVGELPTTVDTAAYRILQEALTNIMRHAAATHVWLTIELDTQTLRLRITDNGRAAHGAIIQGSGIAGMTERARLLGGTLTVQAHACGGFEVSAMLPLRAVQ